MSFSATFSEYGVRSRYSVLRTSAQPKQSHLLLSDYSVFDPSCPPARARAVLLGLMVIAATATTTVTMAIVVAVHFFT